jgi:hypothetical protein
MTNDLIKSVAKKLDDLAPFDKWLKGIAGNIIELFDGKFFEGLLTAFKAKVYDRLSEDAKNDVDTLLLAFTTGDWSNVDQALIDRVNTLIDIPQLNEDEEEELIGGFVRCLFKYIQRKGGQVQAKDGGETPPDPDPDK